MALVTSGNCSQKGEMPPTHVQSTAELQLLGLPAWAQSHVGVEVPGRSGGHHFSTGPFSRHRGTGRPLPIAEQQGSPY